MSPSFLQEHWFCWHVARYTDAYCPGTTQEQRRNPKISPLNTNMSKLKLPPALFTCGTLDPLLDDTLFMSTKWMTSGAEAILKIYPGERDLACCQSVLMVFRCATWLHDISAYCGNWDGQRWFERYLHVYQWTVTRLQRTMLGMDLDSCLRAFSS